MVHAIDNPWLEALAALLLVIGSGFMLVGAVGLVRFQDVFMRLHAPTKASTLGVGSLLLASMLWHGLQGNWMPRELLITLFVFVTAPISAGLMAQAALHLRCASKAAVGDLDRR